MALVAARWLQLGTWMDWMTLQKFTLLRIIVGDPVTLSFRNKTFKTIIKNVSANNLPMYITNPDSVPFKDSFLLVGGFDYSRDQLLDTFLQYVPANDSWIEMPSKLRTPRADATVIPVKRSIFPSC